MDWEAFQRGESCTVTLENPVIYKEDLRPPGYKCPKGENDTFNDMIYEKNQTKIDELKKTNFSIGHPDIPIATPEEMDRIKD